jgi:hypothetical protein
MNQKQLAPAAPQRKQINEMTRDEMRAWIRATRTALQKKMQREQAYLDRRALRGTYTPTDEAYEQDQRLEADLLAILNEMEASLSEEAR